MPKASSPQKKPPVLYVEKGAAVVHGGREYTVLRVVDLNLVLAREPSSGEKVLLQIGTLEQPSRTPPAAASSRHEADLEAVADDDWDEAETAIAGEAEDCPFPLSVALCLASVFLESSEPLPVAPCLESTSPVVSSTALTVTV